MAVIVFASSADVETRLGDSTLDSDRVDALIEDASAMLLGLMGARYDENDEIQGRNLRTVVCNMVSRALSSSVNGAGFGVTQHSMTASSFNEQFSYSNPTGDLYLTSSERKLLGIGRCAAFAIEPTIRPNFKTGPNPDSEVE